MDAKRCGRSDSAPESITQRYENARSELVIASLPLVSRDTTIRQLRHFIAAALALRDACHHNSAPERPLDVLLWLRRRLNQEAKNPEKAELFRAQCLREASKVEREIATASVTISQGGLTILE
ncbi:hypothetical protein [Marinobacter xestospongiae]|uniref:Uncharacterized protein n=1 Tax=Marinobacter xestospongiae TaxID=994319 RepID=A0ABU3VX74_9GAMM|nr:hypothetical protein [Marinobacter xestospongiae]MDV2078351.1 hypothetical protein [Marinobacter xestospongiae]